MTFPVMESPPKRKWTYADYVTWPDEVRCELIDGEFFDMSPGPTSRHQEVLAELITQFRTFLRGKPCRIFPDTDVVLPKRNEIDEKVNTVVRPDLSVVCDPEKIDDKRIRGGPDLVIEILSPRTASYDFIKKRRLYERVKVREFWLVHPIDRIITVFKLEGTGTFGKPEYYSETSQVAVNILPGLEIDFTLVFPVIPSVVRESPGKYPRKKKSRPS